MISCRQAASRAALAGALVLAGTLMLGGAKPAAAGTAPITSCGTFITTPGTYVLTTDLICPDTGIQAAITVSAKNDVHIDLGGHTITGSTSVSGLAIRHRRRVDRRAYRGRHPHPLLFCRHPGPRFL